MIGTVSLSHHRSGLFLLLWGGFLGVATAGLVGLELGGSISRQSLLVITVGSVAGSGIAFSGLRGLRAESSEWVNVPARTLIGVGGILALGSPFVFQPWSYEGLAAGVGWMFTAVVFVVGIGCLLCGRYCAVRETVRPALAMVAVVTGLGWGYVFQLAQSSIDLSPIVLGTLVILFAVTPLALVLRLPLGGPHGAGTGAQG